MPRRIELAASAEDCNWLLNKLKDHPGVGRISLQPEASVKPRGDILMVDVANDAAIEIVTLLRDVGLLDKGAVTISEPTALVRENEARAINEEGNEAVVEEVGAMMRQDTNTSINFLVLMALAGAVASFGIVTDTIHIVVGAMLIAPGFEPILRLAFGLAGHRQSAYAGLRASGAGYLALVAGAAVSVYPALYFAGMSTADLPQGYWAGYWSSVKGSGVMTSILVAVAGGIIVSTRMKVLSTGVMVALALVPSASLVGMGIVTGNLDLAFGGLKRFLTDVAAVLVAGGLVLALKRRMQYRRRLVGQEGAEAPVR